MLLVSAGDKVYYTLF